MPEKRLPATADRAAWEKITKRRAGIRWDNVLEKILNTLGGEDTLLSIEKFGEYKTEAKERIEGREKVSARK